MNHNLLKTFLLVAEHGSFRAAADRVHRSQSAVSAQIKQLEQQVGATLLHRTTRSVTLTTAGEQLRQAVQRSLRELDLGLREIQETLDLRHGRVTLSSTPIVAAAWLPPILARFERDYPAVRVLVKEQPPAVVHDSVIRGEADFALGPAPQHRDLVFEPLFEEDIHALVPRRFLPSPAGEISLDELARLPVLLLSNATSLRGLLEQALRRRGIVLEPKYECTHAQTLIAMASTGLGAAVLPGTALPSRAIKGVYRLRIIQPELRRAIGLITTPGRQLAPAPSRLAQLMRTAAGLDR